MISDTTDGVCVCVMCLCVNAEMFEVYLMRSPQLQSSGECLLRVTDDCVQILDIDNPQRVQLSWPLGFIRRYSVERGMFSLEAGRFVLYTFVQSLSCRIFTPLYITVQYIRYRLLT